MIENINQKKVVDIDKITEFDFIKKFAAEMDFFFSACRKQLRSLWTAYCIRNDVDVDTKEYDTNLTEIYDEIQNNKTWRDLMYDTIVSWDEFDGFMCEDLV